MTIFHLPALTQAEIRAAEKRALRMRGAAFAKFTGWFAARLTTSAKPTPQRATA